MFCTKCGSKLEEGTRFCVKCGTAVAITPVPNTTPTTDAFGGVAQTDRQEQPKTAEPQKQNRKLLQIAVIIPPVFFVVYVIIGVIISILTNNTGSEVAGDKFSLTTIIPFIFYAIILAIAILLTIQGQRKNSRKMIMASGIVYIFTVFGIPSAIMCFIACSKIKKANAG